MKIFVDTRLEDFNFWSGAKSLAENLTSSQFNEVESILEDLYPDGMTDTDLNDLFWFEPETICEWLGIDYEDL